MRNAWLVLALLAIATTPLSSFGQTPPVLQFMGFSPNVSPANKLECRQALAYALNRAAIVSALSSQVRSAQPASTIQHPRLPGYNPSLARYQYDPAKAKELWGQCGAFGPLTIRTAQPQGFLGTYFGALKDSLEKTLGLTIAFSPGDFNTLVRDARAGTVAIYLMAWRSDPSDYDPQSLPLSIGDYLVGDPDVKANVVRRDATAVEQMLLDKALIIPVFHF